MDNPVNGSPTARLKALFVGRLQRFEERRFAARVCEEALGVLMAVRASNPELRDDALYEAVIARRRGLDAAAARTVMRRVHESNEDWESDHVPRFIDVVKYLIVSEYLALDPRAKGMALDLGPFLAGRIDARL